MTPPILDHLEKLAKDATPGRWKFSPLVGGTGSKYITTDDGLSVAVDCIYRRDGEFIAAANPATILTLISVIRQQREALEQYDGFEKRMREKANVVGAEFSRFAESALAETDKLLGEIKT